MDKYDPKSIEQKWQSFWEENKTFSTPTDATPENKYYILPQLPYPSGSGLHVGHAEVYTACDIYARYQRMKGKKVLQVFGLDSFGLPAENYAIKTNVHPKETIDQTGANFVEQVKKLGASVDWDRFVRSSDPDYYKFTQWFFLLMYERGLAYRKTQAVNWCDSCKTVLANAQVVDGHCERCDTVVVQKDMEQWYLKITDYAEKLLEGLDRIDWPEETKKRQKDWIGKSEGAEIEFEVRGSGVKVTVFTTRPDTLFGATYMVLAPEGEYVQSLKSEVQNWDEVEAYIQETSKKTELERQTQKEKTGVELKGVKAVNPGNGEEIPIWIADYVIATYGTGAIMAVPAHDERDFEFATKFGLEIKKVVAEKFGERLSDSTKRRAVRGLCIKDGKLLVTFDKKMNEYILPGGGIEDGEDPVLAMKREVVEETGYTDIGEIKPLNFVESNYYHNFQKKNYQSSVSIFTFEFTGNTQQEQSEEDKRKTDVMWVAVDEAIEKFAQNPTFYAHAEFIKMFGKEYAPFTGQGIAANSDFLDHLTTSEAKEKMIQWLEEKKVGRRKVQYKLRDWSVSRQRFWGAPLPMLVNKEEKEKKRQYVFLHGRTDKGNSVFWPWMKEELESRGHRVVSLDMPNSDVPDATEQAKFVLEHVTLDEDTVVVAHSHGGPVAFHMLEMAKQPIAKLVLVDTVLRAEFNDGVEREFRDQANFKFDFDAIKTLPRQTVVIADNQHPIIPKDQIEEQAKIFDGRVVYANSNARHFCSKEEPVILEESIVYGIKPVPFDELPVLLPDDVDFKPTGQSPLTYSKTFQEGVAEKYGSGPSSAKATAGKWQREVDTLDTFMCSSWYFFRYLDPHNEGAFASPEALKTWMPVDFYLGGPEHVNGHLLYSRFFTKVLFDAGYIDFDEPFTVHRHQGLILGPDGRKMSKRWGNVINPSDVVDVYGADTMRMYEMFMGPLEDDKPWDENGVKGVRRFLEKVWDYFNTYVKQDRAELEKMLDKESILEAIKYEERERLLHQIIKKVGDDLKNLRFNTSISTMMTLLNEIRKEIKNDLDYPTTYFFYKTELMEDIVRLLSPLAPHLAEEIWKWLGHNNTIAFEPWPQYDESKLVSDTINIAVQVNGKVRATIEIAPDAAEDDVKAMALADDNVKKWMDGSDAKKVIYVKGKIVNVVV